MSTVSIRAALETALLAVSPSLQTAFENVNFEPVSGVAYQAAYVLFAQPANPEMGDTFKQEQGIFQINLRYPLGVGPGAAGAQAELIKALFHRAATFTAGGIIVTVQLTPWVGPGTIDGDRWAVPIRITFFANISS